MFNYNLQYPTGLAVDKSGNILYDIVGDHAKTILFNLEEKVEVRDNLIVPVDYCLLSLINCSCVTFEIIVYKCLKKMVNF